MIMYLEIITFDNIVIDKSKQLQENKDATKMVRLRTVLRRWLHVSKYSNRTDEHKMDYGSNLPTPHNSCIIDKTQIKEINCKIMYE